MTKEEAQAIVDQYQEAITVLGDSREAAVIRITRNNEVVNRLVKENLTLARKYDMLYYPSYDDDRYHFNPEDSWDSSNRCY